MTPGSSAHRPISQGRETELQDAIRRRAQQIYEQSGKIPGRDLDNWTQAEAEILGKRSPLPRRTAIVVEVGGVQYVGEYESEACGGYTPGEFGTGEDIAVRFQGEKMFVKRPNGIELETTLVQKIS